MTGRCDSGSLGLGSGSMGCISYGLASTSRGDRGRPPRGPPGGRVSAVSGDFVWADGCAGGMRCEGSGASSVGLMVVVCRAPPQGQRVQ